MMKAIVSSIFLFFIGCYNKITQKTEDYSALGHREEIAEKILNQSLETIDGQITALKNMPAKAYLVVNTASKCGFTYQYEGLEALYDQFKDKGLVIVGFPSNDFGGQEPGAAEEIKSFCKLNFGVSFPLFAKAPVKGPDKQPLYQLLLAASEKHDEVLWNFEKFLLDGRGHVVKRFSSKVEPQNLTKDIEVLLK